MCMGTIEQPRTAPTRLTTPQTPVLTDNSLATVESAHLDTTVLVEWQALSPFLVKTELMLMKKGWMLVKLAHKVRICNLKSMYFFQICDIFNSGYWCPLETANYTDFPCPTGFFCPNGTRFWNENPCPTGVRFINLYGRPCGYC